MKQKAPNTDLLDKHFFPVVDWFADLVIYRYPKTFATIYGVLMVAGGYSIAGILFG